MSSDPTAPPVHGEIPTGVQRRRRWSATEKIRLSIAVLALLAPLAARSEPFSLRLPLACEPSHTCFIQHYVDHDPSPGVRDHACGSRTYDGHNGTDFRLKTRTLAAREPGRVLAAAPGRVLRTRDDAPDVSVREIGVAAVAGHECGNGVVIAHADGYQTQYCHLARGSVRVRPGETVPAGQVIGQVGLSGATEFPHLHLTLRHKGRVIDPFAPSLPPSGCLREAIAADTLWDKSTSAALGYRAGAVLNTGFASRPVSQEAIEAEATRVPGPASEALVAFVSVIGLDAGDVQELTVTRPDGRLMAENRAAPLVRSRAQSLLYVGRRRPADGWQAGAYTATFRVVRAGAVAIEHVFTMKLPPVR